MIQAPGEFEFLVKSENCLSEVCILSTRSRINELYSQELDLATKFLPQSNLVVWSITINTIIL
jgi:hypothetical protein